MLISNVQKVGEEQRAIRAPCHHWDACAFDGIEVIVFHRITQTFSIIALDFLIDDAGRFLAEGFLFVDLFAQERVLLALPE